MKIVSVNVGVPRRVTWRGKSVSTGIFKSLVEGPVELRRENLKGDRQADLSVHGGPTKAVYAYPVEHYDYWRREMPETELPWGSFGENLSVEGLHEASIHIGDQVRVGSTVLVVTEPRMPCYKLGIRLGQDDIVKRFLRSRMSGFYFGIVEEGTLQAGDEITVVSRHPASLSVEDVVRLYTTDKNNETLLRKAVAVTALPEGWRVSFAQRLGLHHEPPAGR